MTIPIVGQPAEVLSWYPTTLLSCKCQPGQLLLLFVTGFQNPTKCPKCDTMYMNLGIRPDQTIDIQVIPPTPKSQLQ